MHYLCVVVCAYVCVCVCCDACILALIQEKLPVRLRKLLKRQIWGPSLGKCELRRVKAAISSNPSIPLPSPRPPTLPQSRFNPSYRIIHLGKAWERQTAEQSAVRPPWKLLITIRSPSLSLQAGIMILYSEPEPQRFPCTQTCQSLSCGVIAQLQWWADWVAAVMADACQTRWVWQMGISHSVDVRDCEPPRFYPPATQKRSA